MDRTQADRETTLHAPQSGSAWIGGVARAVALEQFPLLSLRRGRAGAHQRYGHFADASSRAGGLRIAAEWWCPCRGPGLENRRDRKSTRLNSSHQIISYAVFC